MTGYDQNNNALCGNVLTFLSVLAFAILLAYSAHAEAAGTAKIAGTVYVDSNNSNSQNASESGIAAIGVTLFDDNGTPTDVSDDTAISTLDTAADGSYEFSGLSASTFRVSVDTNDVDLPAGALIGTGEPVYNIITSADTTQTANFGFDLFNCMPGGGTTDSAINAYISTEVDGTGINARNATAELDDDWRLAAGLPLTGTPIPWLGYSKITLSNNEPALFETRGVKVDVALVNIQPNAPCSGNVHTTSGPKLSTSATLQEKSPRPAVLYDTSNRPAFWSESSGHDDSPNAVRFTFATPVKSFGAWFGDLETRTDGFGQPAYLRLLDGSGNRIGADIMITPQTISNGTTVSVVDQNQCGDTATSNGCGNTTTRWIGFIDSAASPRIHQALVIVGDDDFGDSGGSESLSFIGMDINTGYTLSGRVYHDQNVNSLDDGETGLGGVTVVLHDKAANSCRSTQTAADGSYTFLDVEIAVANNYVVYEAANEISPSPATCPPNGNDPTGFISSSPNSQTITVSNADVLGINFADVAEPQFTQENSQTVLPNNSATHPHIFYSAANGSVSFSITDVVADPTINWSAQLYRDLNCNAQLDAGDTVIDASLSVSAGDQICLLVKVFAPASAADNATHTVQVQSTFTYGDGSSGLPDHQQVQTDVTTVISDNATHPDNGAGKLSLVKSVWNVSRSMEGATALPGETLRYTIRYENIGDGPLKQLSIYDDVPAFTELNIGSMRCTDTPASLPPCNISSDGDGSLSWQWANQDKLPPGASGSVSYEVTVQ